MPNCAFWPRLAFCFKYVHSSQLLIAFGQLAMDDHIPGEGRRGGGGGKGGKGDANYKFECITIVLQAVAEAAEAAAAAAEGGFAFAFVEGVLVRAVREGWWLLLDEVNLAPPEVGGWAVWFRPYVSGGHGCCRPVVGLPACWPAE